MLRCNICGRDNFRSRGGLRQHQQQSSVCFAPPSAAGVQLAHVDPAQRGQVAAVMERLEAEEEEEIRMEMEVDDEEQDDGSQ